jgi:hypothetical protein
MSLGDIYYFRDTELYDIKSNGGVFNGNTAQLLGINATYNPLNNTTGSFPIKTTIKFFSGGENNNENNNDIDYIEFNNNN